MKKNEFNTLLHNFVLNFIKSSLELHLDIVKETVKI